MVNDYDTIDVMFNEQEENFYEKMNDMYKKTIIPTPYSQKQYFKEYYKIFSEIPDPEASIIINTIRIEQLMNGIKWDELLDCDQEDLKNFFIWRHGI